MFYGLDEMHEYRFRGFSTVCFQFRGGYADEAVDDLFFSIPRFRIPGLGFLSAGVEAGLLKIRRDSYY